MHMQRVFYKVKPASWLLFKLHASDGCDTQLRTDRDHQNDTDDLIKRHAKKKEARLHGIQKFQHIAFRNV